MRVSRTDTRDVVVGRAGTLKPDMPGVGFTTDSGALNSGFDDAGSGSSGVGNTGNFMSGFFNVGLTGPIAGNPSGLFSGFNSGLLNFGTGIAGLFNLGRL